MANKRFVRNSYFVVFLLLIIFALYYSFTSGELVGSLILWLLVVCSIFFSFKEFRHQEYLDSNPPEIQSLPAEIRKQLYSFVGYRYKGNFARIGIIVSVLVWGYFLYLFIVKIISLSFFIVFTLFFLFLDWYSWKRLSSLREGRLYAKES